MYFTKEDFYAFRSSVARSVDSEIIAARNRTAVKLKELHNDGLRTYMTKEGLAAHWQPQHLTNVIYPFKSANGEYVDYIRMGYGKCKSELKKLADTAGLKITENYTTEGSIAFHEITQLQISLNEDIWSIALYLDKKGWLEQKNLVNKLTTNLKMRDDFEKLLDDLMKKGYVPYIYLQDEGYYYEDANDYLEDILSYNLKGEYLTLRIAKELEPTDENNTEENILNYVKGEFAKLLNIYRFISWDSSGNNYISL